ncbi:MAG: phosphatidylcholine/phosphatidylserine synthase [Alphaproteobacteria bacterium]|nr:phosphatidylcholine/phosphatidylserine synthase [Alphaproteobacteria bacterium]
MTTTGGLGEYFIDDPKNEAPKPGFRLRRFLPNMLTLCGLSAGLLAIQKAMNGLPDQAVLLITFAAIIDTMDGALARLLRATSKFGAELDSLSDFLCFGVAPAFVLYVWVLDEAGPVGWIAVLVFAIACALRLARFNTMTEVDPRPEWARKFFMGVPAPCGAGLALMPVIIYQLFPEMSYFNFLTPLIGVWMIVVAGLMVSGLPTLSTKQFKMPQMPAVAMLACGGAFLAALIHAPWATLTVVGFAYASSLFLGWQKYLELKKANTAPAVKTDA